MTIVPFTDPETTDELATCLSSFITGERYARFLQVIESRTRYLTIVLEDIFQPHNASAVLRSCDCFGIQDVHIIENRNPYQVNPDVALGSSKWLNLYHYNTSEENTAGCLRSLKDRGYRIVAASPHEQDYTPGNLPLDSKTALVFGTELAGLTPTALDMADAFIRIPMVGFTESLNISVSAAILIHILSGRMRTSACPWQLPRADKQIILLEWLKNSIRNSDIIIKDYIANRMKQKPG